MKLDTCLRCEHYRTVVKEEGADFVGAAGVRERIRNPLGGAAARP